MRTFAIVCLTLFAISGQPASSSGPPARAVLACWGGPQGGNEAQSNQQKARAVLDKMIATMGGQNYLTVQDSYSEGRYGRFHNDVQVGGAVYFRYWQWPDKDRWELTKERDIVQLYVGDTAYEVTYRGAHEMDPKKDDGVRLALLRRHYSLENILRTWLSAPGTLLIDEGSTLAENRMAEKITIITADNDSVSILVNSDTHLPAAKVYTIRDPQSRERDTEIEVYDNWRMVQGINTPYSTALKHNGDIVRQQFLSAITYNNHPPENTFTPKLITHK
jgi:hypothetical protein